jgi:drug/metabolite transporter (DMT)-like permease
MKQLLRPHAKLLTAFAAVYLIWGSTFLAIRYAIDTVPPFVMAGIRFMLAGGLLYGWSRLRGAPAPRWGQWKPAFLLGSLLFLQGNGMVAWSEQRISTGLTALLLTTIPLWMTLIGRLSRGGSPLTARVIFGLILGLVGVVALVGPRELAGDRRVDVLGTAALLFGSISWAIGSIYSRNAPLPSDRLQSAGMQMLAGGVLLLAAGGLAGEWPRFLAAHVSVRSALSIVYLSIFGSVIAFSAYLYLLRQTTPARVSTYAFANPLVALLLGWLLLGESLSLRSLIAATCILAAVALILLPSEALRLSPKKLVGRQLRNPS